MISELKIWYGGQIATYQHELKAWLAETGDLDAESYWCSSIEIDVQALKKGLVEPHEILQDTGGMLSGKSLVLYGAEEWKAPQATYVVEKLAEMDGEVRLSMIYRGGASPPKGVAAHQTSEEDRGIPFSDPDECAEWIKNWLFQQNVIVSESDARAVALHCGNDVDKMVQGLLPVADGFEGRVGRDVLFRNLGDPGLVNVFDLMNFILSGDRKSVSDQTLRLNNQNPIGMHAMLMNRFRALVVAAYDEKADLEPFNIRGNAQYYIRKDAKRLGKQKLNRIIEVMGRYDHMFKGGSPVAAATLFSTMADTLTMICAGEVQESSAILDEDLFA